MNWNPQREKFQSSLTCFYVQQLFIVLGRNRKRNFDNFFHSCHKLHDFSTSSALLIVPERSIEASGDEPSRNDLID
ncbi:CLUMA_CG007602, isoform A [Clunio marinus]|uniref:CLUMA_CG007602, isoform A n=1 Tax=Clunio marinus TaxID=568069 RepID=A0A1J1I151_9DIPT|nr:CLUMA_CG007602, isoform A [Clunio marinus]